MMVRLPKEIPGEPLDLCLATDIGNIVPFYWGASCLVPLATEKKATNIKMAVR
jgi:hypothetical protein